MAEFLDKYGLSYFWDKVKTIIDTKQDELISGENIKTINNQTLLGSGNIDVQGGGGGISDVEVDGVSVVVDGVAEIDLTGKQDALVSGSNIKTINDESLLGSGNISIDIPTKTSELDNDSDFVSDASYVHTDNNFTNADVTKLSGIESGAEVNVQANWTDADSSSDAYIQNKPAIPTKTSDLTNDSNYVSDSSYVHTDNNFTNSDVSKLNGIESGAEVNVQANWSQSDSSADDFIKNKPTIPTKTSELTNDSNYVSDSSYVHTDNNFTNADVTKLSGIESGAEVNVQADWSQSNSSADDYIKNKPNIVSDVEVDGSSVVSSGVASIDLTGKQDVLVSGTNIKTVNSNSLLGSGDVAVQESLVSGTNIKTINNQSLLGSGNINISGGGGISDVEVDGVSVVTGGVAEIDLTGKQDVLVSGTNIKTVNNESLLGSGNISAGITLADVYPVGSIYMSVNNVSPATLFGGTWEQIEDTFLLASGSTYSAGSTGGEASHTLLESELPTISGDLYIRRYGGSGSAVVSTDGKFSRSDASNSTTILQSSSTTQAKHDKITYQFGSGNSHNNMPPYLAVYIWKRTA